MSRVGDAWTIVRVVDDPPQTLRDEIEYLRNFGIHVLGDDFKVPRQVREEVLLPQSGRGQRQQPLEAFSNPRLRHVVGSEKSAAAPVAIVSASIQVDVFHPSRVFVCVSEPPKKKDLKKSS